jgi:SNF2 family DNA or RNA helicase
MMRRRLALLQKFTANIIHRRDSAILEHDLPPLHEFVIFVSLTAVQRELQTELLANRRDMMKLSPARPQDLDPPSHPQQYRHHSGRCQQRCTSWCQQRCTSW